MKYLLGVDFGGSSSKATLLGEDGRVRATAGREYPTYYPRNGWAEQDIQDSYLALVDNIRAILKETGVDPADIAALALDAATHTAVLLGADDRPLRRAIYWTDSRAGEEAEQLRREMGDELIRECYNSVSSFWTLPQLMWLKKHEPETIRKTRKIMAVKDYIRFLLTGDYATDSIEAMGFLLLDARNGQWSDRLCGLAGIDPGIMPPVVEPTRRMSPLTEKAREDTGLTEKTLVIAGATDTVMEVYASGAVSVGQATVKLATAGRICPITDHAVVDPRLVTYRHVVSGLWYPGTAGFHTRAHFNRAVLEGVAYSMKDCYETLRELGIAPKEAAAIGGGAKAPLWRQILADMLNIPLRTVENVDSSLGSAMLAGVAAGIFDGHEDAVKKCVQVTGVTEPDPEGAAFYQDRFSIYRDIQAALAPVYHRL